MLGTGLEREQPSPNLIKSRTGVGVGVNNMATLQPPQKEYIIGGVKVLFPVKPYPSQMAMMAQIIKGLRRRQNCLLESPTGSGKSLALLCSTLAWQQAEKEKAQKYNDLVQQGVTDPDILARAAGLTNVPSGQGNPFRVPQPPLTPGGPFNDTISTQVPPSTAAANAAATGGGFIPEDEDPDFRPQTRQFRTPMDMNTTIPNEDASFMEEDPFPQVQMPRLMRVPKIYFGTRTHKQIYQIVKELRRTAYKHVKTDILSSREHTCIHPAVSKMRNKTEGCQQLNDPHGGEGCRFNHGVVKIKTHDKLDQYGLQPAWDIEDLVTLGKKIKACPYYASRSLKETADVVFCPYNYLIDPLIRDTMKIHLNEQIIVLDEAHNIEDSARESTSCTVRQEDMVNAIKDLDKIAALEYCTQECKTLSNMLSALSGWVDLNKEKLIDYKEFDRSGKIFTGTEMIANLDNLQIGRERYGELKSCLAVLSADVDPEDNNPKLKTATTMLLEALFLMYNFLLMDDLKFCDDYRIALVKAQVRSIGKPDRDGFYSKRASIGWEYSMNFWCLNPGVAFRSIGESARSIILTSGTLSPMSSFQSELAVPFHIQLEANHVIDKNQVWVGTVSNGPTEQTLQATYRNVETWEFQDELGRLVLSVCKTVPHGVLCFLPSYSMLNKLLERWQCTGVWNELSQVKLPVTEPRKGEEFEATMSLFYDTITNTRDTEMGNGINGAFFMAVCRGKVSEGLDFTDDNARAVIAVGIPFPNVKDIKVDLKRQYNNQHFKSRGLLSGNDWYEIQAYRALNQALGRCIRHRYDWGALILVDKRYQQGSLAQGILQMKYTRGLSKWVREKIIHHSSFSLAICHLRQFSETMIANPPVKPESLDETVMAETEDGKEQKVLSSFISSSEDIHSGKNTRLLINDPSDSGAKTIPEMSLWKYPSNQSVLHNLPSVSHVDDSICEGHGFDATVVGGLHSKQKDSDFCESEEELVLPPIRTPLTSTQVADGNDKDLAVRAPFTSTQIPVAIENGNNFTINGSCCDQISQIPKDYSATNLSDSVGTFCASFSRRSKKRKSFSFTADDNSQYRKAEMAKFANKEGTKEEDKFKYTGVNEFSAVSPLKASKEKEVCILPSNAASTKNSFDNLDHSTEPKEYLEVKCQNNGNAATDSSLILKGNCSPQLFESDDDFFADEPPSFVSVKLSESIVLDKREIPQSSISTSDTKVTPRHFNHTKIDSGKDNARLIGGKEIKSHSTKASKTSLFSHFPSNQEEDSDLDDFCLDKSYSSPKKSKQRRVSKGKSKIDQ